MLLAATLVGLVAAAAAGDKLYARIERRLSGIARANNASDDTITVRELPTSAGGGGARVRGARRALDPTMRRVRLKLVDMMRQAVYSAQVRLTELEPVLERYRDDVALRMSFIMSRLEQLMLDIKRIYTLSVRWRLPKRVFEQTIWYTQCTRKFLDVLYTVEYAIYLHDDFMRRHGDELKAYAG